MKRKTVFATSLRFSGLMHLSPASPRGGGNPGLMWGLYKLCISKFLQSPQYLAKPSTQLASELYFGSLNS